MVQKPSLPKKRKSSAQTKEKTSVPVGVEVGETSARKPRSSVKAQAAAAESIQHLDPDDVTRQALLGQVNHDEIQHASEPEVDDLDEIHKAWSQEAQNFEVNFGTLGKKIHKFPQSLLQGLKSYIAPKAVSVGPYHRDHKRLKDMQKVKMVSADHFVKESGHPFKAIFKAVAAAAGAASDFYDVQGMRNDDFATMMFLDGCFLLQFMVMCTGSGNLQPSLLSFFDSNQAVISEDIMLLENQLPWVVLSTLRKFMDVPVEEFVAKMGRTLQVRQHKEEKPFVLDSSYSPPHILGLLWHYKSGSHTDEVSVPMYDGLKPMSKTISAIELAEIGIGLKASKTAMFSDMGIKKLPLFTNIFLAPLLLDHVRSSWLVNMVAFEVCMSMATGTGKGSSVVCSYLAILAMLMDREEDVHKLRADRIVQGELTNKEMLDFFKSVTKHTSGGDPYFHIMEEVEGYKCRWWIWIMVYEFFYKNWKIIAAVLSTVGLVNVVGILNLEMHGH